MEIYQICCLTYGKLDQLVREAIEKTQDRRMEFTVIEGLGEHMLAQVRERIKQGIDIILGGGANAKIAREHFDIPVLEFKITSIDYLNAIDQAFTLGRNIGITTYKTPITQELANYIKRLGLRVTNIIYDQVDDLRIQIERSGCSVIVGASHAVELATAIGKAGVLIYPGEEAIVNSFFEAKSVAQEVRKTTAKAMYNRAVIEHSTNGLMLIDIEGKLLECNRSAREIVGKRELLLGCRLMDVLPQCHVGQFVECGQASRTEMLKLNGVEVLQTWVRLTAEGNRYIGAVGIFSKAAEFNRAQLEYLERQRKGLGLTGFTARHHFSDIGGSCLKIRQLVEEAQMYAESDSSVLLFGETGVGKELFAQSLHNASTRNKQPFIAINCAALPENLLESELFGYDEGAFTGSRRGGKKGLFELASGGSIFLDEIGELSPALQARLLRVLQEREIMHIGGDRVIPVNVRMISATNRDLYCEEHQFRRDLLYRLNVLELRIPPLRDREEDVIALFDEFCAKFYLQDEPVTTLTEVYEVVRVYSWPGNIRELQNICERFALHLRKRRDDTPATLRDCIVKAIGADQICLDLIRQNKQGSDLNPQRIDQLCAILSLSREQVAQQLGISRTTLWRLMKKQD